MPEIVLEIWWGYNESSNKEAYIMLVKTRDKHKFLFRFQKNFFYVKSRRKLSMGILEEILNFPPLKMAQTLAKRYSKWKSIKAKKNLSQNYLSSPFSKKATMTKAWTNYSNEITIILAAKLPTIWNEIFFITRNILCIF